MSILTQLSSQTGDRSEVSNRKVVVQCLEDSALLEEIAAGLSHKNAALAGDCAEVLTQVAEQQPEWVAPYAGALAALLSHKTTRVRWEAAHALAYTAAVAPQEIASLLPRLADLIRHDASVIVRDYAVDALANYAGTSADAAGRAYPLLREALSLWDGKQAGHALKGLTNASIWLPESRAELRTIAREFAQDNRAVVRKAAKELLKSLEL